MDPEFASVMERVQVMETTAGAVRVMGLLPSDDQAPDPAREMITALAIATGKAVARAGKPDSIR